MKKIICLLSFFLSSFCFANRSYATSFDGCYQLLVPGAMYPAVCLSGTTEEGINGAGARLAVFHTNTTDLKACFISTGLKFSDTEFVFEINGRRELVLDSFVSKDGVLSGNATVGNSDLNFVKLIQSAPQFLKAAAEAKCN